MNKLHIATSPLTGTIFCGRVLKDGKTWAANKEDKTIEAVVAVAEHAWHYKQLHGGDVVIFDSDGTALYRITVEKHPIV